MNSKKIEPGESFSFINCLCPRCRHGRIFSGPPYGFYVQQMNHGCSSCRLRFDQQPSSVYLARLVNFAMILVEIIAITVLTLVFTVTYINLGSYLAYMFAGILLVMPLNLQYARLVVLYWLSPGIHYDPDWRSKMPR